MVRKKKSAQKTLVSRELFTKSGKRVGILRGNTLFKFVDASKHLFRSIGKNGAWGIDYEILFNVLPENGSVNIREREMHKMYMVPVKVWREHGSILHFKEETEDHYTQCYLPVEYFMSVRYGY